MKNIICMLTLFLCARAMYATGFSDWSYDTHNGSSLYDPGDAVYLLNNNSNVHLTNLTRWYFYEDHIIGEYEIFEHSEYKTAYFILNESTGDFKTYSSKLLFDTALKTQSLTPVFWTRWYYDHYTILQFIWIIYIVSWPIAICIVLFISLLIFLSIALKNKMLKIVFIGITLLLLVPTVLLIINDYFINSL